MSSPNDPFEWMDRMFQQMNQQFQQNQQAAQSWQQFPSQPQFGPSFGFEVGLTGIDLTDHGDEFVATVDLPGFDPEEVDLYVQNNTLQISAAHSTSHQANPGTGTGLVRWDQHQHHQQALQKQLTLPEPIREDDVTATVQNGVLTVTLPKVSPSETGARRIEIE